MDTRTRYTLGPWVFVLVAVLSAVFYVPLAIFFGFQYRWFLVVTCVLMLLLALADAFAR